jgi:CBS domain-containing protein
MQVRDIMHADVKSTTADGSFADVAAVLHDNSISSVVVMDGERLAGIVTERDLVNLVADGEDPRSTRVADRMTTNLDTVSPRPDIAEAAEHMARLKIRHLPVVEDDKLVGIISIRDLTNWAVRELTGGHELPDLERSQATLSAAVEVNRGER